MDCNCTVVQPGPSIPGCGGSSFFLFMAVLEKFLRTQCDVEDPCGQILPRPAPLPRYDFIVVGGGSAGCVLANRLSEVAGWQVLLVEAGVNEPTMTQVPPFYINAQNTSVDWQYTTEPEPSAFLNNGGKIYWPRGKVIGGSSSINGMNYLRGHRKDYDDWASFGNPGWSYREVLPYFIKSENNLQPELVDPAYHGVGGYLPVSKYPYYYPYEEDAIAAARELGQRIGDFNGNSQLGFNMVQTNTKHGVRWSAARSFLRPIRNRTNLHILLNTTVTRVLINPRTKQALGVEIINQQGNTEQIMSSREVVLCAGVINSPKILLQSGVGDEEPLYNTSVSVLHRLPGVGKNLQDWVDHQLFFFTNTTSVQDLNWAVATEYLLSRTGPMSNRGESVIGFIRTKYADQSDDRPDVRLQFWGYRASCSATGVIGELNGKPVDGKPPRRRVYILSTNIRPQSRGYLTLRDDNPLSYPKIYAMYLSNTADIPPIVEGLKFAMKLSQTKSLQKYGLELDSTPARGCENFTFASDEYFRCAIVRDTTAGYVPAGTCKMGPASDPWAVVDAQLRVHGLRGLSVADSSIMPVVVTADTHAASVMIGEKASDMIKRRFGRNV